MQTSIKISLVFIFLVSCSAESLPGTPRTSDALPTETPSPYLAVRQNEVKAIWESGAHARSEEAPTCELCHEVQAGVVLEIAASQEQAASQPGTGMDGNSMCPQCHDVRGGGNAHPGLGCNDCHDPHSTAASCTDSGCHSALRQNAVFAVPPTPTDGHPKSGSSFCGGTNCHAAATAVADSAFSIHRSSHARVSCVACHTASGMQTGPLPDGSSWVLLQEVKNANAEVTLKPAFAHGIQLDVDCTTCHFENNVWGLELVSGDEFGR